MAFLIIRVGGSLWTVRNSSAAGCAAAAEKFSTLGRSFLFSFSSQAERSLLFLRGCRLGLMVGRASFDIVGFPTRFITLFAPFHQHH